MNVPTSCLDRTEQKENAAVSRVLENCSVGHYEAKECGNATYLMVMLLRRSILPSPTSLQLSSPKRVFCQANQSRV